MVEVLDAASAVSSSCRLCTRMQLGLLLQREEDVFNDVLTNFAELLQTTLHSLHLASSLSKEIGLPKARVSNLFLVVLALVHQQLSPLWPRSPPLFFHR